MVISQSELESQGRQPRLQLRGGGLFRTLFPSLFPSLPTILRNLSRIGRQSALTFLAP